MRENIKKLIINIAVLLLAILFIGFSYGFHPEEAPIVILVGILFPFLVAVIVNIFQKNEKRGKIISIALSVILFISATLIANLNAPDPFIFIALVLGSFVLLFLGSCSINIFYLLKNIYSDDKR